LRYEYFTPLREKRGQLSNLILGPNGLSGARVALVDELFQPDRNNFAERIGFAWTPPLLDNKAVLRGGFGISYNRLPLAPLLNIRGNPPFFARYSLCCGNADSPFADGQIVYAFGADTTPFSYPVNPALAQGIDPATGAPVDGNVEIWGSGPENPNAYVYNYSLETQFSLPSRMTATVGYQGSVSHKLTRIVQQRFLYPAPADFFARAIFFSTPAGQNSVRHDRSSILAARLTTPATRLSFAPAAISPAVGHSTSTLPNQQAACQASDGTCSVGRGIPAWTSVLSSRRSCRNVWAKMLPWRFGRISSTL
jgi:hypothetical protein